MVHWLLALLWLALLAATPARADSLAELRTQPLPRLDGAGAPHALASVDGRLLLLAERGAWALDDAGSDWTALRPDAALAARMATWAQADAAPASPASPAARVSAFGDGTAAYLLDPADARVLRLRRAGDALSADALPRLPLALDRLVGAAAGGALYVAGDAAGQAALFRLDPAATAWQPLPAWPRSGIATSLAVHRGTLHLTLPAAAGTGEQLWSWTAEGGWRDRGAVPGPARAVRAIGQAHLVYALGGATAAATSRVATFHAITGAWATLPGAAVPAGALLAPSGDGYAWLAVNAGGIAGARSEFSSDRLLLKWLDWLVIALYLAVMVGVGLYFYLGEKRASTASFFVGGRSIPFWAAGVSLYATNVSSISFIAIPAKAFESNWQYLANNLMAVLGLMFVAVWIVPLLRRLDLMSVFSYLELRFHPAIRMIASALCIVTQIVARMSVILFLPSLAISTITGIDVVWSVLLMGGFTILYTTLGGMKAVIWTDFTQVFVMFGGALFAIAYIVAGIDGGAAEVITAAMAEDKTKVFDFSFDLTKATIWGFIFLVLFDVVLTFPKDQVLMQRVLSTRSDRDAGRSVWMFAAMMIPGGVLFYTIGTALWVFYKAHPERLDPLLPVDATFPLFIAAELPMGVTGLIIAGIFAAAMSTLSSIINSVSTMASVDFYERLARNPTPRSGVVFAEVTGVLVGLVGIGMALVLSRFDIASLLDTSIELFGLFGGGFAGAYTLGMMTRRANSPGVAIGIGASVVLTMVAWWFDLVHPYFYLAISILLCIVFGYVGSLFFPAPTRSLKGLTIFRQDAVPKAAVAPVQA